LKILDLAVTHLSTRTIAGAPKRTEPVDHRSPHVCHTGPVLGEATRGVPLLPPIDQWGALPLPLQRLSPHSLSRRVRDLLAGDLGAHRDLPVDLDPETLVTSTETPPVIAPAPGNVTEPLENDPELATGNIVYYPPARIVDLRPNEFATRPLGWSGTRTDHPDPGVSDHADVAFHVVRVLAS